MSVKKIAKVKFIDKDFRVNDDLLAQYVRVYRSNQRQGTVKTKTKSEVRGGGAKPFRQKGLGRARAGSIRSPLWQGGGVAHGPQPRDWRRSFSKKMKRNAFIGAIAVKINEKRLFEDDLGA